MTFRVQLLVCIIALFGLNCTAQATPPLVSTAPINFYNAPSGEPTGPVAIAGDTLAVAGGAIGGGVGLVYIYQLINGVWVQYATLSTSDAQINGIGAEPFGASLAISPDGSTVFVGDPAAACANNPNLTCGAVDIFQKPSAEWTDVSVPSARLLTTGTSSEELGSSLAISSDGSTLVALGDALYVFIRPTNGWTDSTQAAILGSPTGSGPNGALVSVSVNNGVIASNAVAVSNPQGAGVYVFVEPAGGWQNTTSATAGLSCSSCGFDDLLGDFGSVLQVSGDTILVGAPNISKALVYQEPATGWAATSIPTAFLEPPSNSATFSGGINMMGSTAIVDGSDVLYLYDEPSSGWSSEPPTTSLTLPNNPLDIPAPSGRQNSIQVSGSELATSGNSQCPGDLPAPCIAGYVLSDIPAGSDYDGLMIDVVTIDDLTTQGVRVTSGYSGDELNFNFDVQNVVAPQTGTATFQATASGGALTAVTVSGGGSCSLSDGNAECNLTLTPGQNVTVQATEQTAASSQNATVSASLSNVNPQSWDVVNSKLTASLPLTMVPIVLPQVVFTGSPGQVITGTLPVTYDGKNSLTFTVVQQPSAGKLVVNAATGAFTWTPPSSSFSGETTFIYSVQEGSYTSAQTSVTINEQVAVSGGKGGGGAEGIVFLLLLSMLLIYRRLDLNWM